MSQWTKDRVDGGEFRVVQSAPTSNGFGIAVLEHNYYNGKHGFSVVRTNPERRYVVLHRGVRTEAEARAKANVEWAADKGLKPAELQPVCVGESL